MNYHINDIEFKYIVVNFNSLKELELFKESFSCEDINVVVTSNNTIILKDYSNTGLDDELLRAAIEELDFIEELF